MSEVVELAGVRCVVFDAGEVAVREPRDGPRLVEEALGEGARMIVVPVAALDASFFQLRSGLAGEVLQKAVNYRLMFAVVGDISASVAESDALRDFVYESNKGGSVFFVDDMAELAARLERLRVRGEAADNRA